uniref:Uncharacterized protein n=1 Tax=Leersia perrieri TaxID=77586 RepID=A0A0D9VI27_9ORYZ
MGGALWSASCEPPPPSPSPHGETEPNPTRMPVARYRWWFPESVPGTWIGSSQSRQNSALSSTQKMNAAFSCTRKTCGESETMGMGTGGGEGDPG